MPLRRAGDEAGQGAHLMQQRHHLMMRIQPGAGGEIQLTDAMKILAKEQGLWAYIYEGISYDAGDKLGFLIATVELALQNKQLGEPFKNYLKNLKL